MAQVTIQVVEGLERGQVFADVATPVSIGREDDNLIRLNDERVSRFHAKIQEDEGQLILTDLGSTNGTRVNGHPVQMRVLQVGDQLSIGRCLLVYGSRDEISARADELSDSQNLSSRPVDRTIAIQSDSGDDPDHHDGLAVESPLEFDDEMEELFPSGPPASPEGLSPLQRTQLSDILAFAHDRIRMVLESATEQNSDGDAPAGDMQVDWTTWQRLIALEMDLARYLRKIAEP